MSEIHKQLYQLLAKTEQDSLQWSLDQVAAPQGTRHLMFLNAHGVNMARDNPAFHRAIAKADFLLRDGIGLELAFRALGLQPTPNLNGTDLIPKVLAANRDKRIAVWGSSEAALAKLKTRLEDEGYTRIMSLEHGFHDDAFYVSTFAKVRPDIVVLCMGMPRQEVLAPQLGVDGHDCLIICGGGWANFHSGHTQRAPLWVQRLKLEWFHRLIREPRRLGRRYTLDIFSYFRTLFQIARSRKK